MRIKDIQLLPGSARQTIYAAEIPNAGLTRCDGLMKNKEIQRVLDSLTQPSSAPANLIDHPACITALPMLAAAQPKHGPFEALFLHGANFFCSQ